MKHNNGFTDILDSDPDSLRKSLILIRNSPPRPPLEGNSLCAELWEQDSLRKSLILIRNPLPDLLQRGLWAQDPLRNHRF